MKIVVCVDKSNGMLFNQRRQSQDRLLRMKLLSIINERKLYLNSYSAKQFEDHEKLVVCDDFLSIAGKDDYCFVENTEIASNDVDEVYVFRWNRDYPADTYFSLDLDSEFKKVKSEHFEGSSHKKITLDIYNRLQR